MKEHNRESRKVLEETPYKLISIGERLKRSERRRGKFGKQSGHDCFTIRKFYTYNRKITE